MALIRCPDCTREVSSRARSCPQCAYPIENLTSLPEAIEQNDMDLLRDMLHAGFDPNQVNKEGFSPLMVAVEKGNLAATKILVEEGADITQVGPSGTVALAIAETNGHEQIASYLLENGADDSFAGINSEVAEVDEIADVKDQEKLTAQPQPKGHIPDAVQPPPVPQDLQVEPPPLPKHEQSRKQKVRFIDDTVPVIEDEKHAGPGLICRMCKEQIAAEDIWCAHCKAPIIRRYCGGCRELIPDNAAHCPYCNSSKLHRFRYIRHMEQFVAGSAILAVLLFIFSLYGPDDGSSYAQKLAEKRSEQQEVVEDAAEQKSKQLHRQRADAKNAASATQRAVRVIPREPATGQVTEADGKSEDRIPTVERIEVQPQDQQPAESDRNIARVEPEEREEPEQITELRQTPEATRPESNSSSDGAASETDAELEQGGGSLEVGRRLNEHGFRLMKKGRYAEAIPVLAQSVRSFPPGQKNLTYAYALYNLGRSLRLVGRPDLAIPILEERMKFADQRHVVARELEIARAELNGGEPVNKVEFE